MAKEQAAQARLVTRLSQAELHDWLENVSNCQPGMGILEARWDPSKHPKGFFPQNRGWFSPTQRSAGSAPVRRMGDSASTPAALPFVDKSRFVLTKLKQPRQSASSNRANSRIDQATKRKTWSGHYGSGFGKAGIVELGTGLPTGQAAKCDSVAASLARRMARKLPASCMSLADDGESSSTTEMTPSGASARGTN